MADIKDTKPDPSKEEIDAELMEKINNSPFIIKKRAQALEHLKRVGLPDWDKIRKEREEIEQQEKQKP